MNITIGFTKDECEILEELQKKDERYKGGVSVKIVSDLKSDWRDIISRILHSSMRIPRSNELDFLRLILATSVVFQHAHIAGVKTYLPWVEKIPAVPLFILISGLLVTESYFNSTSLLTYIQKRIRRIVPAYVVVVLIGGILLWILGLMLSFPGSGSALQLVSYFFYNLIFLNFVQPCVFSASGFQGIKYCAVNGSLWTIKFELLFYLILPILLLFAKRLPRILCFAASLLLLSCLIFISSIYLTILSCFIAGMLLSVSKECWLPKLIELEVPSIIRVTLVFMVAISAGAFLPLPLAAIALIMASFVGTKNPLCDPNFLRYGDLSYGIYLVHYPLIQILRLLGFSATMPGILFAPLVTVLSGFVASILYRHVEVRFLISGSHYKPSA